MLQPYHNNATDVSKLLAFLKEAFATSDADHDSTLKVNFDVVVLCVCVRRVFVCIKSQV